MPNALMLLWHMHQPFYKDLAEGVYTMPWVRLHALKDYYGMVAMLEEFPNVHMTFNVVPSLALQIEEYAEDKAVEEPFRVAFKLASKLTPEETAEILTYSFQLNHENLLSRYPRFRELFDKARAVSSPALAAQRFSQQDILDLQVLSQVAWFDEIYLAGDAEIRGLVAKQHGYSEEDKLILRKKEIEIFKVTLEVYKKAAARGQIEVSTSPFYHPILPLLCDTNVAGESHPGVALPNHHFRHPEEAREQLRASIRLHERVFGSRPRGLWPSEGSVSDEVLRIAAEEGFEWAATDEGILARSLRMGFPRHSDGSTGGGHELYCPHRFTGGSKPISLFFRDHQISDLIGFVYSRMDAESAAEDLYHRLKSAARSTGDRPAVVPVILDGENAWEFFRGNGRDFLKSFYRRLESDPDLRALTASEALNVTEQGKLEHIVPGSWINSNFDVWIGADEDNRAWDLLAQARDFFAEHSPKVDVPKEKVELARQELWISEGSDWCWWYGPEHSSAHDAEFDLLYRKHLSNIYRLLGASPPDELAVPIKRPKTKALAVPPSGAIDPNVDGTVTNYFEWLGAGVYVPDNRSGSMHGAAAFIEALYYGYSKHSVYLRVDLSDAFREEHGDFEIRVNVDGKSRAHLRALVEAGKLTPAEFSRGDNAPAPLGQDSGVSVAYTRIFESSLSYQSLGLQPHERIDLQVSLWVNELPVQVLPQDGWLTLDLTEDYVAW